MSEFLAQQSRQTEKLDQLRQENLIHAQQNSARRIADLEARLGSAQLTAGDGDFQQESRFRRLYKEEVRAREKAEAQLRRQEHLAMVIKLLLQVLNLENSQKFLIYNFFIKKKYKIVQYYC